MSDDTDRTKVITTGVVVVLVALILTGFFISAIAIGMHHSTDVGVNTLHQIRACLQGPKTEALFCIDRVFGMSG